MTPVEKIKSKLGIAPGAVFLVVFLFLTILCSVFMSQLVAQKRAQTISVAENEASTIADSFDIMFSHGYMLSTLIVSHNGDTTWFENMAPLIFNKAYDSTNIALRNIAIAPDGIVSNVYPLEGNSAFIGFNLLDESQRGNAEAILARDQRKMVLTNPFDLMQGGRGMGSRTPVYIMGEQGSYFWGLATITIDFDQIVEALNLSALEQSGYDYRLWYDQGDGQQITIAATSSLPNYAISQDIPLSNLTWHLDITPHEGWVNKTTCSLILLLIFLIALLAARIQSAHNDIRKVNLRLEYLAQVDALSGCHSRQFINMSLINSDTGSWQNPNAKYSLLMIDIDNFKNFNDKYGHQTGDLVITAVSDALKDICRVEMGDYVIRYGGDEFIVLLDDISEEKFESCANSLLEKVQHLVVPKNPELKITLSIGGVHFNTPEEDDFYTRTKLADERMYQAKASGRNRCVLK